MLDRHHNEDTYMLEVEKSVNWCSQNDLVLKGRKTFEMGINLRTTEEHRVRQGLVLHSVIQSTMSLSTAIILSANGAVKYVSENI